ncbi:hypothetical protein [Alkalibacter rhizosphaerae]|nr:hypothetical protein [Alkalibacter rhizosphaerae]
MGHTRNVYETVVVGGGISGLTATAYRFNRPRILKYQQKRLDRF